MAHQFNTQVPFLFLIWTHLNPISPSPPCKPQRYQCEGLPRENTSLSHSPKAVPSLSLPLGQLCASQAQKHDTVFSLAFWGNLQLPKLYYLLQDEFVFEKAFLTPHCEKTIYAQRPVFESKATQPYCQPKPRYISATFSMQLKDMINKVVISSKHHPTFHSYIFSQLRVPWNKHQFCLKIKSLNALSEQGMQRLRLILHTSTLHGAQILQKKALKFTEGVPCSA